MNLYESAYENMVIFTCGGLVMVCITVQPHYNLIVNITRPCYGSQIYFFAICLFHQPHCNMISLITWSVSMDPTDTIIMTLICIILLPIYYSSPSSSKGGMESAGLSEFSKHTLREMCSQDWVREKFLREPETLFTPEMLLDQMLSPEQVHLAESSGPRL